MESTSAGKPPQQQPLRGSQRPFNALQGQAARSPARCVAGPLRAEQRVHEADSQEGDPCNASQPAAGGEKRPGGPPLLILIHRPKSLPGTESPIEGAHGERLGKFARRVARSRRFAAQLRQNRPDVAARLQLEQCASWLWFHEFHEHPDRPIKLARSNFCKRYFVCDFCAARRAVRHAQATQLKALAVLREKPNLRPFMFTLTSPNMESLSGMVTRHFNAWSNLVRRRRNALAGKSQTVMTEFEGGILAGETKRGKNSGQWHFHTHGILLADVDQVERYPLLWRSLQQEWSAEIGTYCNVQLEPLRATKQAHTGASSLAGGTEPSSLCPELLGAEMLEVFKYALKAGDLAFEDRWNAACYFAPSMLYSGKRGPNLVRSFGCLRGVDLPTDLGDDLAGFADSVFTERTYRYDDGRYREDDVYSRLADPRFDQWNADIQAGKDPWARKPK